MAPNGEVMMVKDPDPIKDTVVRAVIHFRILCGSIPDS